MTLLVPKTLYPKTIKIIEGDLVRLEVSNLKEDTKLK